MTWGARAYAVEFARGYGGGDCPCESARCAGNGARFVRSLLDYMQMLN